MGAKNPYTGRKDERLAEIRLSSQMTQVVDLRVTHTQYAAGGPRGFRVVLLLSGAGCPP
jgi:hypothetical protein